MTEAGRRIFGPTRDVDMAIAITSSVERLCLVFKLIGNLHAWYEGTCDEDLRGKFIGLMIQQVQGLASEGGYVTNSNANANANATPPPSKRAKKGTGTGTGANHKEQQGLPHIAGTTGGKTPRPAAFRPHAPGEEGPTDWYWTDVHPRYHMYLIDMSYYRSTSIYHEWDCNLPHRTMVSGYTHIHIYIYHIYVNSFTPPPCPPPPVPLRLTHTLTSSSTVVCLNAWQLARAARVVQKASPSLTPPLITNEEFDLVLQVIEGILDAFPQYREEHAHVRSFLTQVGEDDTS